ncbi:hypothetical protein SDC9_120159 [bioreactor metagenome]|uniref:Uncharacterized protein n=1 Tax=bioreactor metagenome TaxID=1076179 RepID=A0A645C945_9ZZZZ
MDIVAIARQVVRRNQQRAMARGGFSLGFPNGSPAASVPLFVRGTADLDDENRYAAQTALQFKEHAFKKLFVAVRLVGIRAALIPDDVSRAGLLTQRDEVFKQRFARLPAADTGAVQRGGDEPHGRAGLLQNLFAETEPGTVAAVEGVRVSRAGFCLADRVRGGAPACVEYRNAVLRGVVNLALAVTRGVALPGDGERFTNEHAPQHISVPQIVGVVARLRQLHARFDAVHAGWKPQGMRPAPVFKRKRLIELRFFGALVDHANNGVVPLVFQLHGAFQRYEGKAIVLLEHRLPAKWSCNRYQIPHVALSHDGVAHGRHADAVFC